MATLRSVLGRFNGTMADVTFSNWKGQNVAKQKVPDTNSSASPAQVAQRTKFALLALLSGTLGAAIRIGFKMSAVTSTEQNVFQSVNKYAVSIDASGKALADYENLVISQGQVPGIPAGTAKTNGQDSAITITWADDSNGIDRLSSDLVNMVAVNKQTGKALVSLGAAKRSDGTATIDIQGLGVQNIGQAHLFYFVRRAANTQCSNSQNDYVHI